MANLFQAIGTVFLIAAFIIAAILSMYLLYIVAIGMLLFGSVFAVYHILKVFKGG